MAHEIRAVDALRAEIKSVDSKINLLAEKVKRLEAQNLTLANSLFKLSERIKKIEDGGVGTSSPVSSEETNELIREKLEKATTEYEAIKNDLHDLKYTIGLINPLEFVTVRQVNELVDERIEQLQKEKKKATGKKKDEE